MEFLETEDGSLTLRHAVLGELYHSDRGAVGEAEHVYIRAGLDFVAAERAAVESERPIAVFEVGFGTGLNAWLTAERAAELERAVDYRAIDLYPLAAETWRKLHYTESPFFEWMQEVPWDGTAYRYGEGQFTLTKFQTDLVTFDFSEMASTFDVVYFDAFAPDAQPELWSEAVMAAMYRILRPGGVLVTYSSKGSVKQALRTVGFEVSRLPGALGKRHMVRARKI